MSSISPKRDKVIRATANNRCGYCLMPQHINPSRLEIEHLLPKVVGGTNEEENLWLACRDCNLYKSSKTHAVDPLTGENIRLFNPRTDDWHEHFEFADDGMRINGKTSIGRATVETLSLNNSHSVSLRRLWVSVGWYPPKDKLST